jgi:DNA anti-recombination protein RmuC
MEEKQEVLAAIKVLGQQFTQLDQQFTSLDQQFTSLDQRIIDGFNRVDTQFATLRQEVAEQLDGVSDALHAETRALRQLIEEKAAEAKIADEGLDRKMGLLGENLGNVRTQLAQYHHRFEAPLEARVVKLEAHAWAADQKKKDGTEAESRRGS